MIDESTARSRHRRFACFAVATVAVVLAYLLVWPIDADPLAWQPPSGAPLAGATAVEYDLSTVQLLGQGDSSGPEDVAIDSQGRLYGGMLDGRIMRFDHDGGHGKLFANTGGRPLGLDFDNNGHLIVADAYKGLLSLDESGKITVLATEQGGVPFMFTDDVDVAGSGLIYFTDASSKYGLDDYTTDFMVQRGYGRLMRYDPTTGTTELLMDGLNFANGVAVAPDESFVLVNETARYCIHRYWLSGNKAGQSEIFIDNLPGFPDGVSCNGTDRFWVALVSPRSPVLDMVHPHPWMKRAMLRLPCFLLPAAKSSAYVMGLDLDGRAVATLRDPAGQYFSFITSVEENDGMLYFGSLSRDSLARIARP